MAGRDRGDPGQGDVDRVGGQPLFEASSLQDLASRLQGGLELGPGRVRPGSHRPALGRIEVADPAQDHRQLGLASEEADPRFLERRDAGRSLDRRARLGPDRLYPLESLRHGD